MLTAFAALAAAVILSVLFIFALLPRRTMRLSCRQFCGLLFAHRGLWSGRERIPENSLPAFRRAVAAGYAIELDVQLTKDGQAVIFHDNTLHRMCGVQGNVHDYTFLELQQFSLDNTKEKIPLLSQVLQLVNGQVPLLIELKTRRLDISVCRRSSGRLPRKVLYRIFQSSDFTLVQKAPAADHPRTTVLPF